MNGLVIPDVLPEIRCEWVRSSPLAFAVLETVVLDLGACVVTIPAGFLFDGASVPRWGWIAISPLDLGKLAIALHDLVYPGGRPPGVDWRRAEQRFTRLEADWLMKELAKRDPEVESWRWRLAYAGVRWGGKRAWNGAPNLN